MSETTRAPAQVFCLAEYLYDEMKERDWKIEDVAVRMQTSRDPAKDLLIFMLVMCVHRDGVLIDDETFDGMAHAFDVSPGLFRNLHAEWLKWPDRRVAFECPDDIFGPISRRAFIHEVRGNHD